MNIREEALSLKEYMVRVRRDLHQIPEIGTKLPKTMAYIAGELEQMGVDFEIKEDISCIFAIIGAKPEEADHPCILLRADVDGLAIPEQSGEPFSCTTGNMHACGHDLHGAALLGAAKILKAHEAELTTTVKLLFQSAEETFEGAKAAIAAGILENPKPARAYASHVFAMNPLNKVSYGRIPMGAVYGFKIIVHGKGGHGSQPENCIDPINAAVQVYLALQALIARECPPTEEAVLTIGQLKAGEAANVIPSEAVLQGTLRTFKTSVRELLIRRINEITVAVAAAYRCKAEVEVTSDCPSVVEDMDFAQELRDALEERSIATDFQDDLHLMGSEDFANIAAEVPSCYFCIGATPADLEKGLGQHNPGIRFNEDAMVTAAAAYVTAAVL